MPHILQHSQRVVYQLVAFVSVNIHHHAYSTSIVLILTLIESFSVLVGIAFCHINPDLCIILVAKLLISNTI